MKVVASLIDVCLACYVTDHHNRNGELLLCTEVCATTTIAEVRDGLLNDLNGCCRDVPDEFWPLAESAIREWASERAGIAGVDDAFDGGLPLQADGDATDSPDDLSDGDEWPQVWLLLEYTEGGDAD